MHPGAVTKSSVGLVVLRKARVSKSKQTDGGSLLLRLSKIDKLLKFPNFLKLTEIVEIAKIVKIGKYPK